MPSYKGGLYTPMPAIHFSSAGWYDRYDKGFNKSSVARLCSALAVVWRRRAQGTSLYIGYDGRHKAEAFALLAGQTLAAYGFKVYVSEGMCPIPALAWNAAHDNECAGAVMVSASETSCEHNGIIARASDGGPVSSLFAAEVEDLIEADPMSAQGDVQRLNLLTPYLEDLKQSINIAAIAEADLRIVVDPMYGAASKYLFDILEKAGASVTELHAGPHDGFAGIHPNPCEPWADECEQVVQCQKADIGLLLDGDADRCALIDERGSLVSPHDMVALVLEHLVEDLGRSGRVITTLTSSMRITRLATQLKLPLTVVPVGFDRIYAELIQGDVVMAAEEYGGVCVPSHLKERDGLYVCLLILEMMAMRKKSLSDLVAEIKKRLGPLDYARRTIRLESAIAQSLDNILPGLNPKELIGEKPSAVNHADGLRVQFKDNSWALLRPSRKDNSVRIYAEAADSAQRDRLLLAMEQVATDSKLWRNYGDE